MKIIKTVATRCQILRLKCTKSKIRLGLPPRPRLGSLQRSPRPLAGFKGPTSKKRGGVGGEGGEERGREGEGVLWSPTILKIDPGLSRRGK